MSEEAKYTEAEKELMEKIARVIPCSCFDRQGSKELGHRYDCAKECVEDFLPLIRSYAEAQQANHLTAAVNARLDAVEKLAQAIEHSRNIRDDEVVVALAAYRKELTDLNHLGDNPPHPFAQLAVALAKWKEAAGK